MMQRNWIVHKHDRWVCSDCGSDEVYITTWTDANSGEVAQELTEDEGRKIFCAACNGVVQEMESTSTYQLRKLQEEDDHVIDSDR